MERLRQLKDALIQFDVNYSDRFYNPSGNPFGQLTRAQPLVSIPGITERVDNSQRTEMMAKGLDGAIMMANIGSRYALPAGGVTLAGKALHDLTVKFGGMGDQPEENQLTLDS